MVYKVLSNANAPQEESFEQEISKAQAPIPKDQMEKLHRDLPGYPHHG